VLLFHKIDQGVAITRNKGVFKQVDLYRRGRELYLKHGAGFIRVMEHGTSIPNVSVIELDLTSTGFELGEVILGRFTILEKS